MKNWIPWIGAAALLLALCVMLPRSEKVAVYQWSAPFELVIDAGHGGSDGGAVSVTGKRESDYNLSIALRVEDMAAFAGLRPVMLRREDVSLESGGDTIASRKVSDLKNRVKIVHAVENPLLLSIHQNHFSEAKYHGAQVFYAQTPGSEVLAQTMQDALRMGLDPKNHRKCKPARGIYLMEQVSCPAVLVECGFLSNPAEEERLGDAAYQKKLAAVMVSVIAGMERTNPDEI